VGRAISDNGLRGGDGAAWNAFHLRYHAVIQKAGRCCAQNSSDAEELSESMMSALFLPISTAAGKKTNKIAQYNGLGSLEGWLKVVVSRMAIDQVRRSQRLVSLEDLETEPDSLRSGEPKSASSTEIDLPKASKMFLASLNHSMNQLDAQEKADSRYVLSQRSKP
jgi:DNA-directed RNA polymerase specialized sigma24 family protein